jgi:hypothetical protein
MPRHVDIARRFWSKVDKNGPVPPHRPELGQCWVWTGSVQPRGYGTFSVGGKVEPVFAETIAELPAAIASFVKPGDVVLTMGAGSIGGVPARLRALGQGAE